MIKDLDHILLDKDYVLSVAITEFRIEMEFNTEAVVDSRIGTERPRVEPDAEQRHTKPHVALG